MTYTDAISSALLDTLDRLITLKKADFAGHAANAEFWAREAAHCVQVLNGYQDRFDKMSFARDLYSSQHGCQPTKLEAAHWTTHHRSERVRKTISRFLKRCLEEKHCTGTEIDMLCETAGVDYIPWS